MSACGRTRAARSLSLYIYMCMRMMDGRAAARPVGHPMCLARHCPTRQLAGLGSVHSPLPDVSQCDQRGTNNVDELQSTANARQHKWRNSDNHTRTCARSGAPLAGADMVVRAILQLVKNMHQA